MHHFSFDALRVTRVRFPGIIQKWILCFRVTIIIARSSFFTDPYPPHPTPPFPPPSKKREVRKSLQSTLSKTDTFGTGAKCTS